MTRQGQRKPMASAISEAAEAITTTDTAPGALPPAPAYLGPVGALVWELAVRRLGISIARTLTAEELAEYEHQYPDATAAQRQQAFTYEPTAAEAETLTSLAQACWELDRYARSALRGRGLPAPPPPERPDVDALDPALVAFHRRVYPWLAPPAEQGDPT